MSRSSVHAYRMLLLAVVFIPAACAESNDPTAPLEARRVSVSDGDDDGAQPQVRTYDVTITNLTSGQPFSPGVLVTHTRKVSVFQVGAAASEGVRFIAEDGNEAPAIAELTGRPGVFRVVDVNMPTGRVGGPLPTSRTYRIEAAGDANRLSLAVMLICTNDGFTGLQSIKLPGGFKPETFDAAGYDAGTEANDERSTSIVDPCFVIGPTPGAADGNARNPTDGVIEHHPGIQGGRDLSPSAHGWRDPVARITVQRVR